MGAVLFELAYQPGTRRVRGRRAASPAGSTQLQPLIEQRRRARACGSSSARPSQDAAAAAADRLRTEGLPGSRPMAVAFADLVGFTRLGEEVAIEELERVANRLAALVADVVDPPVRFVKTIGDAAMLVSPDAGRAARGAAATSIDGGRRRAARTSRSCAPASRSARCSRAAATGSGGR